MKEIQGNLATAEERLMRELVRFDVDEDECSKTQNLASTHQVGDQFCAISEETYWGGGSFGDTPAPSVRNHTLTVRTPARGTHPDILGFIKLSASCSLS